MKACALISDVRRTPYRRLETVSKDKPGVAAGERDEREVKRRRIVVPPRPLNGAFPGTHERKVDFVFGAVQVAVSDELITAPEMETSE